MDASKDKITGDVIFNGDVSKWKKLANSLRMRFAMRISNVAPQKAQEEFEAALQDEGRSSKAMMTMHLSNTWKNHSVSDRKPIQTTVEMPCHNCCSVTILLITQAIYVLLSSISCITQVILVRL